METGQTQEMVGLLVLIGASSIALVYVFLRMAGVIGRNAHRHGRPPPSTPLG